MTRTMKVIVDGAEVEREIVAYETQDLFDISGGASPHLLEPIPFLHDDEEMHRVVCGPPHICKRTG